MSHRPAFVQHGTAGSVIMMAMSDNTERAKTEPRRPKTLTRRNDPAMRAMLTRALPDKLPKLDVAGFQSSI